MSLIIQVECLDHELESPIQEPERITQLVRTRFRRIALQIRVPVGANLDPIKRLLLLHSGVLDTAVRDGDTERTTRVSLCKQAETGQAIKVSPVFCVYVIASLS